MSPLPGQLTLNYEAPARKAKTLDAAKIAKSLRDAADKLGPKIDHAFRDSETNTAKKIAQKAHRTVEGRRMERVRDAFLALADLWDRGEEYVPGPLIVAKISVSDAITALGYELTPVSNGYHGYHVETSKWRATSCPKALALRKVYDDAQDPVAAAKREAADKLQQKLDALRGCNIEGFFPTPPELAAKMVDALDIDDRSRVFNVLEPSAGIGSLCDAIRERFPNAIIRCCEIRPSLCEVLDLKGYSLADTDFLRLSGTVYDFIIMNPPFERGQDIDHIRHAYSLLRDGGILVCLMGRGAFTNSARKCAAFREWLAGLDHTREDIDAGAFSGSGAFRQTGVATTLVVIRK